MPGEIETTGHQIEKSAETDGSPALPTRRDVVRCGVKLTFVAPMVSTFFARDAYAAGSKFSCYPAGHVCPGAEPCCSGSCNALNTCD